MQYLARLSSITLLSVVLTPSVSALSLYLSVDKQALDVPLYQEAESINLYGYGLDISHVINDEWSIGFHGQQSEHNESQSSSSLEINAQQHSYSASVNYSFNNYLISLAYHQLDFELATSEELNFRQATKFKQYTSFEEVNSKYIELNVSRDIDFDNSWLTLDLGLFKINQQTDFGSKLTRTDMVTEQSNEANSDSWLIGTTVSWATLWSWQNIDFVPSAKLNFTTVFAGDDVYLFNTINGISSTGQTRHKQSTESEQLTGDSAFIVGGSLTVLITTKLYADINFNRVYADNTTDNYLSLGIGWDF